MDKPQLVSSSTTILLKFALPICWITFFGLFTGALWLKDIGPVMGLPLPAFRALFSLFFAFGVWLLYWMVMRLKRIEIDSQFIYVTNYFKNFRYPFHNIDRLVVKDYYFFKSIIIHFKTAGHFGEKVTFLPGRTNFDDFMNEHPEVAEQLNVE